MKIKFLVAEEIRPEAGGKLTILGLYPDDNLILSKEAFPEGVPPETPRGMEKLVFLISIGDAPNKILKYKVRITDPSGGLYKPEMQVGEGRIEKGTSRSFIIEVKPFLINLVGVYVFNFHVNKEVFSFPFEIRANDIKAR
ncbi:MAG: hypothetical protein ABL869_00515 [Candidatus Nitrotoga sp.]